MKSVVEPKTDEASILRAVLQEISDERQALSESTKALVKKFQSQVEAINDRDRKLVEEFSDAKASLKSVERFEKHLSKKDYDAKRREAQEVFDGVAARHKLAVKRAAEEVEPIQEQLKENQQRATDLLAEFNSHKRMAKVLGIDLNQFFQ